MTCASRRTILGALAFVAMAAIAPLLPPWLVSLATIAFANALVVLGLIILWRTGLVPFGQALFYAIGAYAVALIGRYTPIRDVFVVVLRRCGLRPASSPTWSAFCWRATAKSFSRC